MNPFTELTRLATERKAKLYPNVPDHCLVKPKYSDTTANDLTTCIIDYIKFIGGYAVRINTQGQYNEKLKKWTKGTTTRGTADVHACISGLHFSIEIKIGKDQLSTYQIETKRQVEQAGGFYFVAGDFPAFYEWINSILKRR
jgi:hypothetical protein